MRRGRALPWGRVGRRAVGAVGLLAVGVGALGAGAGAQEQDHCANHSAFSALGSATAIRTAHAAPGYSIVTDVDANLPGAQALVDSVLGSKGWAGAPFVPLVAENAGQAGQSPNDVPVFATTEFPAEPEASNSTPAATVSSKSEERSSTARAEGGGPASEQAATGRSVATATSACAADGTLKGLADTSVDVASFMDVLRISSVTSHALVERTAQGELRTVESSMSVEGVTVLGQPVGVGDKGLVLGSSAAPLPDNPLAEALEDAGITVRYVAAEANREKGEVTAPGLEVSVTGGSPDGRGPITTTYIFGRAYARVTMTAGDPLPDVPVDTFPVDGFAATGELPAGDTGSITAPAPATSPVAPAGDGGARGGAAPGAVARVATARIGSWSVAPAYSALGVGLLLLVAWVALEMIAARRAQWR